MKKWISVLGVLLVSAAVAAPSGVFPTIKGKDLTGASVSSENFRGKPWMVVVGFEKVHAKAIEGWSAGFKQSFPDASRADLFAIVALDGALKLFRGPIDKGMSKDKPEHVRRRIMSVYAADSVCKELGIKDRKVVYVFVLDSEGRIVHRETGDPNDAGLNRVTGAARKLLTASS